MNPKKTRVPGKKWDETSRIKALARAIVEGKEPGPKVRGDQTWKAKSMRICKRTVDEAPSKLATGKREVWEDWHTSLKRPDPDFNAYEFFNLLRSKDDEFLKAVRKQDREQARSYEKMASRAYMSVLLIDAVLEFRGEQK